MVIDGQKAFVGSQNIYEKDVDEEREHIIDQAAKVAGRIGAIPRLFNCNHQGRRKCRGGGGVERSGDPGSRPTCIYLSHPTWYYKVKMEECLSW
jgi:hypothetical protein